MRSRSESEVPTLIGPTIEALKLNGLVIDVHSTTTSSPFRGYSSLYSVRCGFFLVVRVVLIWWVDHVKLGSA